MNANTQGLADGDVTALAVEVLRVLADRTRLLVAIHLVDGERSVSDLAEHLGRPVPAVSQHLAKMRMARLVTTRREGTTVHYALANDHVRQLVVDTVRHVEHLLSDTPPHHRVAAERRTTGRRSP